MLSPISCVQLFVTPWTIASQPTPTKQGCTFGGWYTDSDFTEPAGDRVGIGATAPITVYAKWIIPDSSIMYSLDGGVLPEHAKKLL